jgi:CRISPR-associated endonuclease Cas2
MRTCYLVAYDIADPKRLQRVHRTMRGYGDPLQYSVFRCILSPTTRKPIEEPADALAVLGLSLHPIAF